MEKSNKLNNQNKQGKVEITRCVIYVPAGSVNLWTGINEFVAAKDIYFIEVTATTTTKFSSPYLVLSHKANEIKIGFAMAKE